MRLGLITRTWLLQDVGSDYQDEEEEIPEVLQTEQELEEANIIQEPVPEEIDIDKNGSEDEKESRDEEGIRKRFVQRDNKQSLLCQKHFNQNRNSTPKPILFFPLFKSFASILNEPLNTILSSTLLLKQPLTQPLLLILQRTSVLSATLQATPNTTSGTSSKLFTLQTPLKRVLSFIL